jgi:hypothetical protein
MLRPKRRSYVLATASVFAALYAALGFIPVSRLVLGSGFLTANKIIAPLAGMLFGPLVGSMSSLLGDLIDLYAGTVSLATIVADIAVVVTAGLAFTGRRKLAVALPVLLIVWYSVDPLAVEFVGPFPFVWLHLAATFVMAVALFAQMKGRIGLLNPLFVGSITLGALMAGQLAGTIAGMNLLVRFGTTSVGAWKFGLATFAFPLIPFERTLYTVMGTVVAVPVLRAVSRMRTNPAKVSG